MTDLDRLGALFDAQQTELLEQALAEADVEAALPRLSGPQASLGAWLLLARRGGPWAFDAGRQASHEAPPPFLAMVRDAGAACGAPERLPTLQHDLETWQQEVPSAGAVAWCLGALATSNGRDYLVDLLDDPAEDLLVRVTAAGALRHGTPQAEELAPLLRAVREPDASEAHVLRREVVLTLGERGDAASAADLLVAASDPDPAVARTAWWALERSDGSAARRLGFATAATDDLGRALVERIPQVHAAADDAEKVAWLALASRSEVSDLTRWAQAQRAQGTESQAQAAAAMLLRLGDVDALADALRGWCSGGPHALPCLEAVAEVAANVPRPLLNRALLEVGLDAGGPLGEARLLEVASWLAPQDAFERARAWQPAASPEVARELTRLLRRADAPG